MLLNVTLFKSRIESRCEPWLIKLKIFGKKYFNSYGFISTLCLLICIVLLSKQNKIFVLIMIKRLKNKKNKNWNNVILYSLNIILRH